MRHAASIALRWVAPALLAGALPAARADATADTPVDAAAAPADAPTQAPEAGLPGLWPDALQASLSTGYLAAASRLDRLFGQDRLLDEDPESRLMLSVRLQQSRFGGSLLDGRARPHGVLPRTRRRLALILDEESVIEEPDRAAQLVSAVEEARPDLGLRYWLLRSLRSFATADAGVRGSSPIQAFARMRAARSFAVGPETELRLLQTVQYFTSDRWVESTELRWRTLRTRPWIAELLVRGTWREARSGYEPALVASLMREMSAQGALRLDVGGQWPEMPHTHEAGYFIQGARRARLGRPWLFGEVRLGVGFPQEQGYAPDPSVAVLIEVVLGTPQGR